MHIKGPHLPFIPMPPAVEPKSKESAGAKSDAAMPDTSAHPASKPLPSALGRSTAYLLRQQFAAGAALKRPTQAKGKTPAESGAVKPEQESAVSADLALANNSAAASLSPATAITQFLLGTPEEKSAAQNYLADFADAIIGAGRQTVAAEMELWSGRDLRRPGFAQ